MDEEDMNSRGADIDQRIVEREQLDLQRWKLLEAVWQHHLQVRIEAFCRRVPQRLAANYLFKEHL